MKIRLTKNRKSVSLRFRAQNSQEGVDLKDIVLGLAKSTDLDAAIAELGKRGYSGGLTKETRNTREFTVRRCEAKP